MNNVETLVNIPIILEKGAKWFTSLGTDESKGTKVFSISGKVENTGLVEVEMGTKLRDIIFRAAGGIKNGKRFKAVHIGGPSGGCLSEEHLDIIIDYDAILLTGTSLGSAGMVVVAAWMLLCPRVAVPPAVTGRAAPTAPTDSA